MEGHQQINYFFCLSAVRCRDVELMTLNIALLGKQPKYCEIPFFFELALFSIFLIALRYIFRFWNLYFCFFLMCCEFFGVVEGCKDCN